MKVVLHVYSHLQTSTTSLAVVGIHYRELVVVAAAAAAPNNRYRLGTQSLLVGQDIPGMAPAAGTLVVGRRDTPVGVSRFSINGNINVVIEFSLGRFEIIYDLDYHPCCCCCCGYAYPGAKP